MVARVLIGADPELFVTRDGKYTSAHNLIKGTKADPFPVGEDGAVQVDGMALEFNITPAANVDAFCANIGSVLASLRAMVPQEYAFAIEPVALFDHDHMEAQPPEARALGCEPDFCAWTGTTNPPPEDHPTMRTASGHVHVGWTKVRDPMRQDHFMTCSSVAVNMDYLLGIPSILFDQDNRRRAMYGKAGAFRPKPYGLEYRTLSNFWLCENKFMRFVYHQAMLAYELYSKGFSFGERYGTMSRMIIDTNNVEAAEDFCNGEPLLQEGLAIVYRG